MEKRKPGRFKNIVAWSYATGRAIGVNRLVYLLVVLGTMVILENCNSRGYSTWFNKFPLHYIQ